jgi:hypothetical protein
LGYSVGHLKYFRAARGMGNSNKIAVIIVNFNGKEFLGQCLESLQRQVFLNFKIFVVDNSSDDRSVDGLEERFPGVEVMRMDENVGFAAANKTMP